MSLPTDLADRTFRESPYTPAGSEWLALLLPPGLFLLVFVLAIALAGLGHA